MRHLGRPFTQVTPGLASAGLEVFGGLGNALAPLALVKLEVVESLANGPAHDLAQLGAGKLVKDGDRLGHRVVGQLVLRPPANCIQVNIRARLEHQGCDNLLAARAIGNTNHRYIDYAGHGANGLFDLRRIDVEPTADDEFLAAVDHDKEVIVLFGQIAGAEPFPTP